MLKSKFSRFALFAVALTVILIVFLVGDLFPYLRGGFGWRWPYVPAALVRMLPLVIATVVYIVGAALFVRRDARVPVILAWSIVGALVLTLLVIWVRFDNPAYELFARTVSRLTSGQHNAAAVIGWGGAEWKDWAAFVHRPDWEGGHVAVAAPGLPMWYALLGAILDRLPAINQPLYQQMLAWQCQNYDLITQTPGQMASAIFGMLMPLWGSLSVLPLYALAHHFPRTRRLAKAVVLWYPLVPSLLMFAPDWNVFYPCLSLLIFGCLVLGIERRRPLWLLLSGVLMGTALFMVYTFAPLVVLMGFYTLFYCVFVERQQPGFRWYRPITVGLWFGLGMSIPWLLYWLWCGVSPLAMASLSLSTHLQIDRPYLPWVFIHYWDWTLFNGFVLMLVWYAGLWQWARKRRTTEMPVLALSLLLTATLLAVSGTARGESGRVWSVFTPFMLLAAAEGLNRLLDSRPYWSTWLGLTAAHSALMLTLVFSLSVITTDLSYPPAVPTAPAPVQAVNADFKTGDNSGGFRLLGWTSAVEQQQLTLKLRWQPTQVNTRPFWFGAVLVAPDGSAHNAGIWQPGGTVAASQAEATRGTYPTTCWAPNTIVGDTITFTLPTPAAGNWWVSLSVFGDKTQADGRLRVTLPTGATDSQVGLGPIVVSTLAP